MERHKIIDDVSKIKNKIFISFIYIAQRQGKGEFVYYLWAAIKFETKKKLF